jgi:hypothetical protein
MQYLLKVADSAGKQMVVLTLPESMTKMPAIDVVFELFENEHPESLLDNGILSEGQLDDFKTLQMYIFDRDDQGLFIRDDINFVANGKPLNPDEPIVRAFLTARREGVEYRLCDVVVTRGDDAFAPTGGQQGSIPELARLMVLHQIAIGTTIDVTKDIAELVDFIAWAEKEGLIEIDVQKASYKLTEKGKRMYDSYIEEGQNLIRSYDIFSDVDIDSSGEAHFDTGLGRDLRIAVYEVEGIDPFRARFLLGLNDGEWDKLPNWEETLESEKWYREIFAPVENAPSVDHIGGEALLRRIIEQGKAKMRREQQYS